MRSFSYFLVLALIAPLFVACSTMDTDSRSPEEEVARYGAEKNGSSQALDELGWSPSRKLTPEEDESLERRIKLNHMEAELTDVREREQYFKFKPLLDNDDERLTFLNLPTIETRDRYAMEKGIYFHANKFSPSVRDAVSHSDIILGMNKDAVIESWGEPAAVEVAGLETFGNERWRYVDYVETAEGYQREERLVIFEGGKVAGWQKQ